MIHLYLTLPNQETPAVKILVEEILSADASVGLVQTAAGGDEETMRRVAGSHIRVCEGLVAISNGSLQPRQVWEIDAATAAGIPVLVIPTQDTRNSTPFRRPHLDPGLYAGFIIQFQQQLETAAR